MDLEKKQEMEEAEANFEVAQKALEKAERDLVWTVYWAEYAIEHRN